MRYIFFITTGDTHCWSLGLKLTVSYIGNTTLIGKAKKETWQAYSLKY
jgi:hypothetical protein